MLPEWLSRPAGFVAENAFPWPVEPPFAPTGAGGGFFS